MIGLSEIQIRVHFVIINTVRFFMYKYEVLSVFQFIIILIIFIYGIKYIILIIFIYGIK